MCEINFLCSILNLDNKKPPCDWAFGGFDFYFLGDPHAQQNFALAMFVFPQPQVHSVFGAIAADWLIWWGRVCFSCIGCAAGTGWGAGTVCGMGCNASMDLVVVIGCIGWAGCMGWAYWIGCTGAGWTASGCSYCWGAYCGWTVWAYCIGCVSWIACMSWTGLGCVRPSRNTGRAEYSLSGSAGSPLNFFAHIPNFVF